MAFEFDFNQPRQQPLMSYGQQQQDINALSSLSGFGTQQGTLGMENYGLTGGYAPVRNAPIVQTPAGIAAAAQDAANGGGMFGDLFKGATGPNGWGGLALGAIQGIGGAYMGMKQYGLAKDALKHNKNMFNKNYEASVKSYNTRRDDIARARHAANPTAYRTPEQDAKENRLS